MRLYEIINCLLAMHTLICITFSLPPGVRGWLQILLVALPGLFCLPFLYILLLEEVMGWNKYHAVAKKLFQTYLCDLIYIQTKNLKIPM